MAVHIHIFKPHTMRPNLSHASRWYWSNLHFYSWKVSGVLLLARCSIRSIDSNSEPGGKDKTSFLMYWDEQRLERKWLIAANTLFPFVNISISGGFFVDSHLLSDNSNEKIKRVYGPFPIS